MIQLAYIIPFFIGGTLVLSFWSVYDRRRFARMDGDIKRGLRVWVEPLTWETRQFLETFPSPLQLAHGFVRRQNNEVLLGTERSFWGSVFKRGREYFFYVGYVNLSGPESQLELRLPWSAMAMMVFNLMFVFVFIGIFWTAFSKDYSFPLFIRLFPFIMLLIMVGSFIFNHLRERNRILALLKQALEQIS